MIGLAIDLAEKQIREGTASSQVITHFLRLGSSREQLEQLKIEHDIEMTKAKTEALEKSDRMEELMSEAIQAMRSYQPGGGIVEEYDDEA